MRYEEFDAIFALGANFFAQGKYRQAKIIFDGLVAKVPHNQLAILAAQECSNRLKRLLINEN